MDAFFDWFRWLYDETGINLTFIYDSFDRVRLVNGFWTTIWLSAVCLILSVIIGIVGEPEALLGLRVLPAVSRKINEEVVRLAQGLSPQVAQGTEDPPLRDLLFDQGPDVPFRESVVLDQ